MLVDSPESAQQRVKMIVQEPVQVSVFFFAQTLCWASLMRLAWLLVLPNSTFTHLRY